MVLYICIIKYILKTTFESTSTDIGDGYFWKHVDMSLLHTDKIALGFPVCGDSLRVGEVLKYIDEYISKLLKTRSATRSETGFVIPWNESI